MLAHWATINVFVGTKIIPSFSFSGNVVSRLMSGFSRKSVDMDRLEELRKKREGYGMEDELVAEILRHSMQYCFAEDIKGVNEEATLCLKMGDEDVLWGVADDYADFVSRLVELERQGRPRPEGPVSGGDGARRSAEVDGVASEGTRALRVQAFFGETDFMIGEKGQQYFEQAWSEERCGGLVDFESITCPGADHDSVVEAWRGALGKVFSETKKSLS